MTRPCFIDDQEKGVHMSAFFLLTQCADEDSGRIPALLSKKAFMLLFRTHFSNYNKNVQKYWFIQATLIVESQPKTISFVQPTVQLEACPEE